jgi:hypothetical protein
VNIGTIAYVSNINSIVVGSVTEYSFSDAMVQNRKNADIDLIAQKPANVAKKWLQILKIYAAYSKAYQQGILTFDLKQCKLQSAYAFLYNIETQSEEYLKKMSQVRKIERIRIGIEMIGETTFPIDALPTDLLLLILQQLLSYDISALLMTSKGTVNALNRIDQHYYIWKSIFLRQKYMSPSDVNSTPENDWKRLLVKDDR